MIGKEGAFTCNRKRLRRFGPAPPPGIGAQARFR